MIKVWEYIDSVFQEFESCFSRKAAFQWFVVLVIGFMLRHDHLGVTSVIREFGFNSDLLYQNLIHYYHSTAWKLQDLQNKWLQIVRQSDTIFNVFEKPLLIGDGQKKPKEGKYMPAVKKTHQESGDSSKPEYTMAHLFGGLGIVIGNSVKQFCLPLSMMIQDGNKPILEWMGSEFVKDSHVTCLIRQACKAAASMVRDCYLLMDRYFLTAPGLTAIAEESVKAGKGFITLITKAKSDYTAYEKPGKYPGKGRPRKKGKVIHLFDLFSISASLFTVTELEIYGKQKTVEYYCVNLLWGRKLYQELRFVLTIIDGVKSILVSTDLLLHPEQIILLYCYRFKIEVFFRAFSQCIAGLAYHFWNSHMPKLNPFEPAKAAVEKLALITDKKVRESIISTYRAIEGYVMICCIAAGIIQICAVKFYQQINSSPIRWLRTYTNTVPSEESTQVCLQKSFWGLFNISPKLAIVEIVLRKREEFNSPLTKTG